MAIKPILKWAGGKRWLASRVRSLWHKTEKRRLVEPFCGGLAITLAIKPQEALVNDINSHLINFYHWVQQGLQISREFVNEESYYYKQRDRFNELITLGKANSKESAELFYYLNRTGYNGLCRFNQKGQFNVPFGRYNTINYQKDYRVYTKEFRKWEFTSVDFQKLTLNKTDFIYADPPYDVEFTQYSSVDFKWDDQVRLAKWLSCHEGPVVLSNQATDRIIKLYEKHSFEIELLNAPRRISCTGDRSPAIEILATKNM